MTEENNTEAAVDAVDAVEEVVEATGPKTSKRVLNMEDTCKITVVSETNPKREGSKAYDKFETYLELAKKGDFTVADYIAAGHAKIDLRYDFCAGFIAIEGAEVEEYEVTPRGEKAEAAEGEAAEGEAAEGEAAETEASSEEAEVAETSGF